VVWVWFGAATRRRGRPVTGPAAAGGLVVWTGPVVALAPQGLCRKAWGRVGGLGGGQRARMETFSPVSSGAPSGPFLRATKIIDWFVGPAHGCPTPARRRSKPTI